ncbi:hypothetical protein WR25_06370 [Diploscapter pachys]|uniref:Uncharacterized protein n=1 Tax=Diploscapter pachys TaxID=2018661 RepID=A0A2A2KM18_9BILA|nr:hypothetical protein WR25_06370 [Diploscapter pachys]
MKCELHRRKIEQSANREAEETNDGKTEMKGTMSENQSYETQQHCNTECEELRLEDGNQANDMNCATLSGKMAASSSLSVSCVFVVLLFCGYVAQSIGAIFAIRQPAAPIQCHKQINELRE